ncbi:hypothetical protein [Butyrivibrio sp.]|uniref:hypothetical protein n=1 Tax=Butyrivibrio sp. TaxID=28121 RepID=UPI0025B9A27E|nr:hypothetical protein [Butyrivibrio sp.]MBQ7428390.1 hypothetical protein [Butyrivibrio sp.]MBQ9303321.1 hypothetical protein [Butyrivibrio sp.]
MKGIVSEAGTTYHAETPVEVIKILDNAIKNRLKLRIWYGDPNTGRDWMEVYDVYGYIGRSCGTSKIPLLVKTSKSMGGGAILDHCIVKITADKKVVYKHSSYYQPELKIVDLSQLSKHNDYPYSVYAGDTCIRNCKTRRQAENEIAFHKGLRNVC